MSSSRVDARKAQISAAIRTLKESSNLHEKCKALSSIHSAATKSGAQDITTDSQAREICKLVMNAFTTGNKVLSPEAGVTLVAILKSYKDRKINLFNELIQINYENRLKIFQLFEGLQDDTIKALSRDSFIVDFLRDCLSSVTHEKMDWLAADACTDNTKALQIPEYKTLSSSEQVEEKIIVSVLELLHRLYNMSNSSSYAECAKFSTLFTDKVATLAYMGHKRQRGPAIKLLHLPNMGNHLRSSSPAIWQDYKTTLQNVYCQRMTVLVTACEPDWSLLWTASIQLLGTDLHRGAGLINNLLSVEEKAFKSVDTVVRRQAFLSWKLIVDNFSLDEQELATARRVKLLCIPLNAKNSKTEAMTLTKLEVWWHLIYKLYKHIEKFTNPVLTQFLNFCFGPLGDTPLLSSKFNVIASPGKRFCKTRLVAIDALLQLLSNNTDDLNVVKSSLEEKIPEPVSLQVFQDCFKPFVHSIGEALLALAQLSHKELDTRVQVIAILWRSLLARVKGVRDETAKVQIYKEIMLLVVELGEHSDSKPIIRDSMLEIVLPSLDDFPNNYVFQFDTIGGLMSILTKPAILKKIVKKHQDLVKRLLWRGVSPAQPAANYVPNTSAVLRKLVMQLDSIKSDAESTKGSSILWNILCEMTTKYMVDGGEMNEGDAACHDFTTIQTLIKFPFAHHLAPEFWQFKRAAVAWKGLYRQFDLLANLVPTVKPNEIVSFAIAMIQDGIQSDKQCAGFAVTCLDSILTTMNYKQVLDENGFLPIVKLINDLCILNLPEGKSKDAEAAFRGLSSVLITLYGHAPDKVASCLEAVRPAIEHMLKPYNNESLVKEITSTWETIMTIFKGLGGILSPDVIVSFQGAIRLALRHKEPEIVSQTLSCLETEEYMNGPTKELVEAFLKEKVEEGTAGTTNVPENGQKQIKATRVTSSFLNRKIACPSPKPVTPTQKPRDERKSPFFPDPESQEYVMIKSDFKFDANRLTEHQKESLLRRREDIPALYNDLSQSCSQDTQNIQEWFDKKKTELEKVVAKNSSSNAIVDTAATAPSPPLPPPLTDPQNTDVRDANNENNIESGAGVSSTAVTDAASTAKEKTIPKQADELGTKGNKETKNKSAIEDQNPGNSSTDEDNCESTKSVAKKLDFESRTEFPDDGISSMQKSPREPSTLRNLEAVEVKTRKSLNSKGESETTQNSIRQEAVESRQETRRGVKRKLAIAMSDSECEESIPLARRRRKNNPSTITTDGPSDSDSVKSMESDDASKLSKRTKIEISRLQINMVFDSKQFSTLPSRRRSKIQCEDEQDGAADSGDLSETGKSTRQKTPRNAQESAKARIKRMVKDPKNSGGLKIVKKRGRPKNTVPNELVLVTTPSEIPPSPVVTSSSENTNSSSPDEQEGSKTKPRESPEFKESKEAAEPMEEVAADESSTPETKSEPPMSQSCNDSEEIVESSQASSTGSVHVDRKYSNKQCFIRINKIKSISPGQSIEPDVGNEKTKIIKGVEPDSPFKACATEISDSETLPRECGDEDDPMREKSKNELKKAVVSSSLCNESTQNKSDAVSAAHTLEVEAPVVNEANSSPPEVRPLPNDASSSPVRLPTSLLNSSSPKNSLKRYAKLKSVTTHGRAAHMLGLVTKQAIAETKLTAFSEEDVAPGKKRSKEGDEEFVGSRKERLLALKELERLGSPSGSRQEKIFNKMKTAPENEAPPTASNLFGNLKNDGEKSSASSPSLAARNNAEKERAPPETTVATVLIEKSKEKADDNNTSPTQEREPLPMLEWSSANPPSLTASPSASILKRQRQLQIENDPESPTLASKRKRVSFADPPVSKEMGYEIPPSTPAHRMNKISGSRIFLPRKDSPVRLKQTKLKSVHSSLGKSDKEMDVEVDKCMVNEGETQANQTSTDADAASTVVDDSDSPVIIFPEPEGQLSNILNEEKAQPARGMDSSKVMIDNLTMEIEIASGSQDARCRDEDKDIIVIKEVSPTSKPKIDETETQQDIFDCGNTTATVNDSYKSPKNHPKRSPKSAAKSSPDENSFRCVDINILTNNSSVEENNLARNQSSIEVLEDTVDIQNITGLNSTTNSEELFCSRPVRTSTSATEADTLPVTDSVFASLPFSQNSQDTNDTMELDQPELLDSTRSIFPSLTESCASIDSVIGYLADPLWKPHLSSYLHSKGIETVGNLAQLTEREVNWIPVKRSPKVPFVRNVLQHFERSIVSLPSTGSTVDASQESVTTTPNASMVSLPPSSTPIAQSSSLCQPLEEQAAGGHSFNGSSTARVEKVTQSTETQVSMEELLDEIDASVVLKSAIKRCSAENILANYKLKMKNMAEEDLERETIKMLGIELKNHTDAHLKSACRASGVSKVLGRLPDIFSHDKQFFAKVLTTYRRKLSITDCINGLDFEEIKTAVCQRCTSSDLAEMLSKKLKEEEEAGVTTPMTELSSLQAMLKRMPKDLIISHTVANEELISPLIILDIALQNNNPADISVALDAQPTNVRNRVFGDLCTIQALTSQIEERKLSDDVLSQMLSTISKQLDTPKLLDAFNAIMKEKFIQQQQSPPQPPST